MAEVDTLPELCHVTTNSVSSRIENKLSSIFLPMLPYITYDSNKCEQSKSPENRIFIANLPYLL